LWSGGGVSDTQRKRMGGVPKLTGRVGVGWVKAVTLR